MHSNFKFSHIGVSFILTCSEPSWELVTEVFCCMWQKTMCSWMIFLPVGFFVAMNPHFKTVKMTPSKSNHWLWMGMGPKYHTKDVTWTPQSIRHWHDSVIGLRWNPWHDAGIDVIARLVANNWSVLAMYGDVWVFLDVWWCFFKCAVFTIQGYNVSNMLCNVQNDYGPWRVFFP